jgi:hypothetical protein
MFSPNIGTEFPYSLMSATAEENKTIGLEQCFPNGVMRSTRLGRSKNKGSVRKVDYNIKIII